MNSKAIGIVGNRNSGKTTFTIELSEYLASKDLKVAIIKFMHHAYSLDPKNKDSALFRSTRARYIISASPYEIVSYEPVSKRIKVSQLLKKVPSGIDYVLIESYPAESDLKLPLIFVCKDSEDFEEIKLRFTPDKPLFITGRILNENKKKIDGILILTLEVENDKKLINNLLKLSK